MKRFGEIYKIINLINDCKYFGQTIKTLERRFKEHIDSSEKDGGYFLHKAIRKYGIDNFKIEVVCRCPESLLDKMETYYIAKYRTNISRYKDGNGYNLTDGGRIGGSPFLGHKQSDKQRNAVAEANRNRVWKDESRNKISEANTGREFTEEHLKNMSLANMGKPSPMKGKHQTEEANQKNREKHLGKKDSEETRVRKSKANKKYFKEHPEVREKTNKNLNHNTNKNKLQ